MEKEEDISKYAQLLTNSDKKKVLVLDEFQEEDHDRWYELLIKNNYANLFINSSVNDIEIGKLQEGIKKDVQMILFNEKNKGKENEYTKEDIKNICYFKTCDINLLYQLSIDTNIRFDFIIVNFLFLDKIKDHFEILYHLTKLEGKIVIQDIIEIRKYQEGDQYVSEEEIKHFNDIKNVKNLNYLQSQKNFHDIILARKQLKLGKNNPKLNISHIIKATKDKSIENSIEETKEEFKKYQKESTEEVVKYLKEKLPHSTVITLQYTGDKNLLPTRIEEKDKENFTFQYYIIIKNIFWSLDFIAQSLPSITKPSSGSFQDPQTLLKILNEKVKEETSKMFILEAFDVLAINMKSLWVKGKYPPPSDKNILKGLSDTLFFYPDADLFLSYASGNDSWKNRIILLSRTKEQSISIKELLAEKGFHHVINLDVFGIKSKNLIINVNPYLLEFFNVNNNVLKNVEEVYFIRSKNNVYDKKDEDVLKNIKNLIIYDTSIILSLAVTEDEENIKKYNNLLKMK